MRTKLRNIATQTDHPALIYQSHSQFRTYDNNYDDESDDESDDSLYYDGSPSKPKIIFQSLQDNGIYPNLPVLTQHSPRTLKQSCKSHFSVKCLSDDCQEFEQGFKKLTEKYSIFNVSIICAHNEICGKLDIRKATKKEKMFHKQYYDNFKYIREKILQQIEELFKEISKSK